MKHRLLATVLALAWSNSNAGVATFGLFDCGQWFEPAMQVSARSWLVGYLSGINYSVASGQKDPLDQIKSASQIFFWMDNYCRANPQKTVTTGANDFYFELARSSEKN